MQNLPRRNLVHGNISLFSYERLKLCETTLKLLGYISKVCSLNLTYLIVNISLQWSGMWMVFTEILSLQVNIFCFHWMSTVHWLWSLQNVHSRQIVTRTGIFRICLSCVDYQTLCHQSSGQIFTILQFVVPKFQLETKSAIN